MRTVKRVIGHPVRFGGEEHTGWLPPGVAVPLPTPVRNLLLDIEILADEDGFILAHHSNGGSARGDTWHQTLADAETAAEKDFGVRLRDWRDA